MKMDLLKAHVISPLTLLVVTLGFKSVARFELVCYTYATGQASLGGERARLFMRHMLSEIELCLEKNCISAKQSHMFTLTDQNMEWLCDK